MTTDAIRIYLKELYSGVFSDEAIEAHLEDYVGFTFADQVTPLLKDRLPNGGRVLDVGAGFGSFVLAARRLSYDAYGLEIAPFEVEQARLRLVDEYPDVDSQDVFRQGDGQALPFEDAFFDAVSLWNVIEHVPDRQKLVDEISRVLKPGGRLLIIAPNYAAFRQEAHYLVPWLPYLPRAMASLYLKMWGKNPAYFMKGIYPCTNQQVLAELRASGFSLRPLFNIPLERPQRGEIISEYLRVRLDDPEQVETGWKRTFLRLLKRLHMRWVIWRLLYLRTSLRLWLGYLNYARRWWAFESPWVQFLLVEAQKRGSQMNLMVIILDELTGFVGKGEIQPCYFNPGNLADVVHIVMTNNDQVNSDDIQSLVGEAQLFIHNIPVMDHHNWWMNRLKKRWLIKPWAKPFLAIEKRRQISWIKQWAKSAVELASQVKPDLIRCHGNFYNACAAQQIKERLGIPYIVSLHTNPDAEPNIRLVDLDNASWQDRLYAEYIKNIEQFSLKTADLVIPVYQSIVPYLQDLGITRYEVAYNILNHGHLTAKTDFALHDPVRLITVGRLFDHKNPENIIRAVAELPQVEFTVIGSGPYLERLRDLAISLGIEQRVFFTEAVPNDQLCQMLPSFDIFVAHNEFLGISKAQLEALLTGMPCIANKYSRMGETVPELQGDHILLAENTKEGYMQIIIQLLKDDFFREQLGKTAFTHAGNLWSPKQTEAKYIEIYQRMVNP
jgi:glycosyltransferase involved in cell wall biosynthesis/protein-L-isoaspartate O-methyltransferase